jgi:hypothetical protein
MEQFNCLQPQCTLVLNCHKSLKSLMGIVIILAIFLKSASFMHILYIRYNMSILWRPITFIQDIFYLGEYLTRYAKSYVGP